FVRRVRLMSWPFLAVRVGELDGPASLVTRVDFEEAVAIEAAGQAVLRSPDRELALPGAHEGAPAPLAAAIVVDRVDVVEPAGELPAEKRFAAARRQVPPSFRHPALGVAVAEGHAD